MRRVITLLMLGLFISGVSWAYEESPPEDGSEGFVKRVEFDEKFDQLEFIVPSKKASGGYKYRTVGFIMHKVNTNGQPMTDPNGQGILWLHDIDGAGNVEKFCRDEDDDPRLADMGYGSDYTMYTCEIPAGHAFDAAFHGGLDIYQSIGYAKDLMLSPIFIVSDSSGNFREPPYDFDAPDVYKQLTTAEGLNGIMTPLEFSSLGIEWSEGTKESLRNYFDMPVTFYASAYVNQVWVEDGSDWRKPGDGGLLKMELHEPSDLSYAPDTYDSSEGIPWKSGSEVSIVFENRENISGTEYELVGTYAVLDTWDKRISGYKDSSSNGFEEVKINVPPVTSYMVGIYKEIEEDEEDPCVVDPTSCLPPDIPDGGGSCSAPSPTGNVVRGEDLSPLALAEMLADSKGANKFDVSKGIPGGESLYLDATAKEWLYKFEFVEYAGECEYDIVVSKDYNLEWEERRSRQKPRVYDPETDTWSPVEYEYYWVDRNASERVSKTYDVVRDYSYWRIDNLEVYGVQGLVVANEILPDGQVRIGPVGYEGPQVTVSQTDDWRAHVREPEARLNFTTSPGRRDGGKDGRPSVPNEDWTTLAESLVGNAFVRNDSVVFDGVTIMDGDEREVSGSSPISIPNAEMLEEEVLYKDTIVIPETRKNVEDSESQGTIMYQPVVSIKGGEPKEFPVSVNSVSVHTPVVNYAEVPDSNRDFDQSATPDMSRPVLVLGREFTVRMPNNGAHLSQLGYGDKDYSLYVREKEVRFPFGVYFRGDYYDSGEWIKILPGSRAENFELPVWVSEGDYEITVRTWSVNSDGTESCGTNLNGEFDEYCAEQRIPVKVVGRMFDFQVSDVGDLRFETVFRVAEGSDEPTGFTYYSGQRDENGVPKGDISRTEVLPVRPGSHPDYVATVPNNGYKFYFELTTVGDYDGMDDGIVVEPTFWFVPKNGGHAQEVDLYYDTTGENNKMIKVGNDRDKEVISRRYELTHKHRNISESELVMAASYEYEVLRSASYRNSVSWDEHLYQFMRREIELGRGFNEVSLDYRGRTVIGPDTGSLPSEVHRRTGIGSIQRWYGEYSIPIAPRILPKDTNLYDLVMSYGGQISGREPEFLKGGYIIVNFNIYAYKDGNKDDPVLLYEAPNANMWEIEGQVVSASDYLNNTFHFRHGDIIMFHSDFSVRNDFQSRG